MTSDLLLYCTISLSLITLILLILWLRSQFAINNLQRLSELKLEQSEQNVNQLLQERLLLQNELEQYKQQNIDQTVQISELKTRLQETLSATNERQRLLEQSELRLTTQFENLANRIFAQNGKQLEEQNRQSLHHLLFPLREQLEGFKKQIQDSFGQEAKERHTLTYEIRNLQQLNEQMSREANNLTNALKGNNKIQGNWGEFILNQILENAGLRDGYEYQTQVSLNNEDKQRLQPDVIVHLPQGGDVVIDAKMTLIAYERYFNSEDAATQEAALTDHLTAVRTHLKQLSQKDYHKLIGINSLDYILMFIPIEPAFLSVIEHDPAIINDALKQNIMLVSPSTLLVALRTIHNLWRFENQNQNAKQIAERAGKLYDKMRLFIDDMEILGSCLDKAQQTYQNSLNKLAKGRGNLLGQIERFRDLGVPIKKAIKEELALTALEECHETLKQNDDDDE